MSDSGEVDPRTLYVVSTPIGNLEDISRRASRILSQVDLIAAEDTRHTRRLLEHHGMSARLSSYHDHNKTREAPKLIHRLKEGASIALVSDAGTPGISDPGFYLIRMAVEEGVRVVAIPGASALLPALTISGLASNRFYFEGFLPIKKGKKKRLQFLAELDCTIIIYESVHRIVKTLAQLEEYLGDRQVVVARELTKCYEEALRGTLSEVQRQLEPARLKGEFVIVVEGRGFRAASRTPGSE